MPVNEIRDTLSTSITTNDAGFGYATRKINIKDGFRNGILSIDVFNDNGGMWLKNPPGIDPYLNNVGYQLFVSPYPMLRTSEPWGLNAGLSSFAQSGQMAGEPNVLYKEIGITDLVANNDANKNQTWISRFPNDSVSDAYECLVFSSPLYQAP